MRTLNTDNTIRLLNKILEYELAGVIKYTQFSLIVTGPYRSTIVQFLQEQASESLTHAQSVGEILTGLDAVPAIGQLNFTQRQLTLKEILEESAEHEQQALNLYKELLTEVEGASVYLEEFVRGQIGQEELHHIELRKMLRDFSQ